MLMRKVLRIYRVWRKTSSSAWTTRLLALDFLFQHIFYHEILRPFSFWVSWDSNIFWIRFPPSPTAQGLLEFAIFVFSQQFSTASRMARGFCMNFWWLFADASSGIAWHIAWQLKWDMLHGLIRRSWGTERVSVEKVMKDMLLPHLANIC